MVVAGLEDVPGTVRVVVVVRGAVGVTVGVPLLGRVVVTVLVVAGRAVVPEGVTTVRVTVVGPPLVVVRAVLGVAVVAGVTVVAVVVVVGAAGLEVEAGSLLMGLMLPEASVRELVTTLLFVIGEEPPL